MRELTSTTIGPARPFRTPAESASPSSAESRAWVDAAALDVAGLRVVSGTGEELGVALRVEPDRFGVPKYVAFQESPHGPVRLVQLRFVRGVEEGAIRLAGPREGYHITRLARDAG